MKLRRMHAAVIAGVMLTGIAATQAGAATKPKVKPVCNLITDEEGDATAFAVLPSGFPNAPALDVLSADIATGAKNLSAVIRVKDIDAGDTIPTAAHTYYFNFNVGDTALFIHGDADGTGGVGDNSSGLRSDFSNKVVTKVDTTKNEITMTVPLSEITPKAKITPGTRLTALNVFAQRSVNLVAVNFTPTADDTSEGSDYKAGTPSCLKVS